MVGVCSLALPYLTVKVPFIILTMTSFIESITPEIGPMAIDMVEARHILEMGVFIQVR